MNDQDMEYLGNINTSPGPNAGRSIDPTNVEREQMCAWLRSPWRGSVAAQCRASADEIERLAALAQSPPRPDASAGLIEAAEIVYAKWAKLSDSDPKACGDMWELYNEIRARAAVRSGK